ncbi:MAG: hypothetical protein WA979_06740 [Pacificimonas sp.]
MTRTYKGLILAGVAALALSGCDDPERVDGPTPAPTPTPTPTPTGVEDQFGANFAAAFRVDEKGEAIDPMDGDIIDLTLKADPVDIPDPAAGTD